VDARRHPGRQGAALSESLAEATAPVVEARAVTKRYASGTIALAPVDVVIRAGEFVALLGPSGCGKTTLLNLLAGLLAPSAGEIRWWGTPQPPAVEPDRRLGYVFQTPTLMPWARVAANVRLPLDLAHVDRAQADVAVRDALEWVGLARFGNAYPRELSGGMQMRASIARALVTQPSLLLMDEPFGALDEFTRQRLDDELLALWRNRRLTIAFVTHSIVEAAYLATRIVVMGARPGRVLETIAVDAPAPRGDAWRMSPGFAELSRRVAARVNEAGVAALDAS
jgi:NitT/TauT family transport system ATP-binding protein